jgi:thiol-disulfide isomerase/thioredoxin
MINLCYVLLILLVALMIKLYLDANKNNNNFKRKFNNTNNTNYDLESDSDSNFKKILQQIKTDTESKINAAVEEGFSDGYQAMLDQDNNSNNKGTDHPLVEAFSNDTESAGESIVSYLNKTSSVKLMLFYKMECPYCQEFMPVWNRIINDLPNNVKYEEIECNKETKKANENNISSVPTIILLVNNEKKIYMGDRSYSDINRFMLFNGVNLVERTFEQFDSTGYSTDIEPKQSYNSHCPAVTFDKQADITNDSYLFQIFNADGQYGYANGGYKGGKTFTPFTAAYSAVDSYLSSLPYKNDSTKSSYQNINECASLYSNQIRNFGLCDKDQLDSILKYQTNIKNGSGKIIFDGTDYSTNKITVDAIKKACLL